ncbi:hypothetical protein GCM10007160_08110 [Litchfieldella qijiaojingensis]|uniref:Lipoprotein n=1 Tax=Litchfieldella qijiaojingensis TaxID=980347 RepID=A0ABQ2YH82_9GAMM|nr:hypothetical protein [Halomonas qijiaojingensis]GGX82956.1 hypothetical protein GCM10007160_08110 [Halomonas qijiaojingensis]
MMPSSFFLAGRCPSSVTRGPGCSLWKPAALVLAGLLLSGCAAKPGADLPQYGDSVRRMIELQTYAPEEEIDTMRGDKPAAAMEAYRAPAGSGQARQAPAAPMP